MRRLVVILAVAVMTVALAPFQPAQAATTFHWAFDDLGWGSSPRQSILADRDQSLYSFCPGTGTTDGMTVRAGGTCTGPVQLTIQAPSGTQFTVGQVLTATIPAGSVTLWNTAPVQPATIDSGCYSHAISESLTILGLTRDGSGVLTSFAADYTVSCSTTLFRTGSSVGSVRWNDATPYTVGGITSAYVAPSPVPLDRTEDVQIPVGVVGAGSLHVNGVSLAPESSGTSVASTTCVGADISAASPCSVTVHVDASATSATLAAYLDLTVDSGATVHVGRTFTVRGALTAPKVYPAPTSTGVVVVMPDDNLVPTDTATVYRRVHGQTDWGTLATGVAQPAGPAVPTYVDTTAVAGTTYDYAVAYVTAGSPSYTTPLGGGTITVPASTPTSTARSATVGRDDTPWGGGGPSTTEGSTATGATEFLGVDSGGRASFSLSGTLGSPIGEFDSHPIPGPGTYTGADLPGGWGTSVSATSCGAAAADVLTVRQVLYDTTGKLSVLDASTVMDCSGTHRTMEIRVHTDAGAALPSAPASVSVSADPGGADASVPVTVTNAGPDAVTLGTPALSGPGAAAFSTTPCAGPIAAGGSCDVTVTYHPHAAPTTDAATLTLPVDAAGTTEPALVVSLGGRTTDLPGAPVGVTAVVEPGRTLVSWTAPVDDGGHPVVSYTVERQDPQGWTSLGSVATTRLEDSSQRAGTQYRVAATTSRGTGPVTTASSSLDPAPAVAVGTVAEEAASQPWGLYVGGYASAAQIPLQVDGHEHENPTATPDGRAVVFSRAETAGSLQDDFDLFRLPFAPGSTPVQLTDTTGAEVDAETSPDGTRIAYTHYVLSAQGDYTQPSVCVIPSTGSTGVSPTCLDGFSHPSWRSPGVLVASDDRTVTSPLVSVPVTGTTLGTPTSLTGLSPDPTAGGSDPTVSPDGSQVAYADPNGQPAVWSFACGCASSLPPLVSWIVAMPRWIDGTTTAWSTLGYLGAYVPGAGTLSTEESSGVPALDTTVPSIGDPVPAYVKPGATVSVPVTDAGTPRGGLVVTCAIDSGAAMPCAGSFSTVGVAAGHHALHVTATDPSGNVASRTVALTVDGTPPPAPTLRLPSYTLTGSAVATFSAADALSPVTYQVRVRTWPPAQTAPNAYGAPLPWSASTSKGFYVATSGRLCVQVRAHDAAGNLGAWSAERCSTSPVDDRSLRTLDRGWTRITGSAYLKGTATQAKHSGLRLVSYTGLSTDQVAVVATACPTCGSLSVRVGGVLVGSVSLHSATTVARKVFVLPLGRARYGQVQVTTTSASLVRVDAVIPLR